MKIRILPTLFLLLCSQLFSCASSTEGGAVGADRKQFFLMSSDEVVAESEKAYSQVKADAQKKGQLDKNPAYLARVNAIAKRLIPQTTVFRPDASGWAWETHVLSTDEINAYCMPGGKIMVYTGIIDKLKMTDGELAAVMGHEMAHALREHGREQMSRQAAEQLGIVGLEAAGVIDQKYAGLAAGAGALLIMLPHSRAQETEADTIGVELMARAGYNPHEAENLWRKMANSGGSKPPEYFSDHPADEKRLAHIESLMPKVMPLYEQAPKAN